jgi:hypothetical protein
MIATPGPKEDPMRLLDSVLITMGLSQPFRRFLGELLMLLVIVPGRATFLNLSRYSDYAEKTFRRWLRRKVDWAQLNVTAIRAVVPGDHESVLAFDPSFVPKSGKRTAGLGHGFLIKKLMETVVQSAPLKFWHDFLSIWLTKRVTVAGKETALLTYSNMTCQTSGTIGASATQWRL